MEEDKHNICFFGASFDTSNMGVSALAYSLIKLVVQRIPNAKISLLIGSKLPYIQNVNISGRNIPVEIVNYRLSPKSKLQNHLFYILLIACIWRVIPSKIVREKVISRNRWLRTLLKTSFIGDIWGGDSFSDIYGFTKFFLGSLTKVITIILKKEYILLPQTYGPYRCFLARKIARSILSNSSSIYCRDKQSINLLETILQYKKERKKISFCPDVAFTLDAVIPKNIAVKPPLEERNHLALIGLNISGLMYKGGSSHRSRLVLNFDYKIFISRLIEKLMEKNRCKILIIPHSYGPPGSSGNDEDNCNSVFNKFHKKFKNSIHIVDKQYNQNELKGIIGLCDFFIGSRMHSCIAAISQGVPTIGVAYSKKFIGVFNSVHLEHMVIDARIDSMKTSVAKISRLFDSRNTIKKDILKNVNEAKRIIELTFDRLLT